MSDQPGSKRTVPKWERWVEHKKEDNSNDIDAGDYTKFAGMLFVWCGKIKW